MPTYHETLDFLYHLEVERMDLKLERVTAALQLCGSPHLCFPALHVAGTNGKGSTAALLHSMLSAADYRVGLFTSPHLIDFRERIRLGSAYVSERDVVNEVAAIRGRVEPAGIRLTPFEMMTVLAFSLFARARIDVAVIEVGLGGRLDATNVLSPLVSAITSIGLDHQAYLGSTLADIAREKGGIIKPGVPVVIGHVDAESRSILYGLARQVGSAVYAFGQDFTVSDDLDGTVAYRGSVWRLTNLRLGLRGRFQQQNAAVALAALEVLRTSFPLSEDNLRQGLRAATWPGRLDVVSEHPLVVLDGAHNPQAIETLIAELPSVLRGRRVKLLFSVMRDKDWQTMVPMLTRIADEIVVTRVQQARAEDPAVLRAVFTPFRPIRVILDAQEACQQLMTEAGPNDAVVVCGSLFLVGEVYPLFAPTVIPSLQRAQEERR
ncbi:MAG TPA: folylpolyglutamate synthase/dihydrofolate synthase family protein [Candidatus Binatia bacterium]|jgi:dihydrofolate synthase/folylpolyglutamate synthase|nr:folylpolyglutamate synthase/dihydrofolate synthase family protein [Candidatus Binatia bacterium]